MSLHVLHVERTSALELPECPKAPNEVVRHSEVEPLGAGHLQREISIALTLELLGAGQLELAVIANVIADHFLEHVEDAWGKQVHAEPAEPRAIGKTVHVQPRAC